VPEQGPPRVVRRIVCGYEPGLLAGDWLQAWRRLRHVLDRADLAVPGTLAPLDDLPDDTDVLIVPPELVEAARLAAPTAHLIATTAAAAAAGFDTLAAALVAGVDLTATRSPAPARDTRVVNYRGPSRLD
jgi:hypothetical protein